MRWNAQQVLEDGVGAAQTLPGLRGLLRTVRTPEFAGTVFHEVEARSALNRVPGSSPVPFRWTVNPYRGCSHACVYCLAGPTRVLMADGSTRPIAELRVGDAVVGTEQGRYVRTTVLAHWSTSKPAYAVRLRGGTELVGSGEHRFLTERGWRHVTGGWCRSGRRPHLTPGSRLLGPGPTGAVPARRTAAYRQGYLCGLVRGDGPHHAGFPSARLELEALGRAHHFLAEHPLPAVAVPVGGGEPGRIPRPAMLPVGDVVHWPEAAGDEWCAGFLGGLVDACGTVAAGELRIGPGADEELVGRAAGALHRLGFRFAMEPGERRRVVDHNEPARCAQHPSPSNNKPARCDLRRPGSTAIHLLGGPPALLRLVRIADPAVTRRRDIGGAAVAGAAKLEVADVRALGVTMPMYDITTGTGDFVAGGVVSHNCFARNTHTYLDMDAGADFDSQIVVKVNVARVLERELRAPKWAREPVAMGTNTDPYQRAEGRYRLMPGIIGALARSGTPFSVLTKGTVLARDLPQLAAAADDVPVGLGVSIALVDRGLQGRLEPGTPSPAARLDLVRRITDAGLPCGVMVAPVLPLLTDSAEALDALLGRIAAAGATGASVLALHLRPGTREWFLAWLAREYPALVEPYARLYRRGAYVDPAYRRALGERVAPLLRRHGLDGSFPVLRGQVPSEPVAPEPEQLTLL
jgi:DNA repair photolyase